MKHLTVGAISDYVRGTGKQENLAKVLEHLPLCPQCADTESFYRRVLDAAFRPAFPIPPELVASVKSLFETPEHESKHLKQVLADLVFPPGQWTLAGVRSVMKSGSVKQAVYQWGDFFVDLRSEVQADSERLNLLGQLSSQRNPLLSLDAIRIRILAGAKTVAETRCNNLGEFTMTFMPSDRLQLQVDVPEAEVCIKIMLKDLNPRNATP